MSYPPTDKQWSFIERLVSARTVGLGGVDPAVVLATLKGQRLTSQGGGALIDHLLKMPADPIASNGAAAPTPNVRPNRYPGNCVTCGANVPAMQGTIRKDGGRWVVLHLDGQCGKVEAKPEAKPEAEITLPDGYYAVPCWTGANDLTFIRISTNKGTINPANAGKRYVKNVAGGKGELDNVGPGWVAAALAAIEAVGPEAAAQLYGQEIGHCGRCHRPLTDETSRKRGLGPECAGKSW